MELFRNDKFDWIIQSRLLLLSINNNKKSLPKGQNIKVQVHHNNNSNSSKNNTATTLNNNNNNNNNNDNNNMEGRIRMKM